MRCFLILYLCVLSNILIADEIPALVQQDPKTVEWYWSVFSVSGEEPKVISYLADFTKQSKTTDGTIFLPWVIWDVKNKKWLSATLWSRINCEKNTIDSPGTYERGLFSSPTPVVYEEATIGAYPKHMICGITSQDGAKIYGLFGEPRGSSWTLWGWIPDEVRKADINGMQISFNLYSYTVFPPQKFSAFTYLADCANKKIIYSKNTTVIDVTDKKNHPYIYTYKSVCDLRDKLVAQNDIPYTQTNKYQNEIKNEPQPEKNHKDISLENAKVKCEQLGFKPKTEKFGNCVLELVK